MKAISAVCGLWSRFWFQARGREQLGAFRGILALILFVFYGIRTFDLELFYSNHGMAPLASLPEILPMDFRYSLLTVFPGDFALWFFHLLFLASLLALAFGVLPRLSAIAAFALQVSFVHRNLAICFGADTIATFYLFYLMLADWRPPSRVVPDDFRAMLGSVAYRFAQIQLCVIYGFSGFHKLKGAHWLDGDALWYVFANFELARFDLGFIARYPLLIAGATYLTLAWEILFPFLVWFRPARYPVLVFGILMHLGMGLTMNIPFFGTLMILIYALFLNDADAKKLSSVISDSVRKLIKLPKVKTQAADQSYV